MKKFILATALASAAFAVNPAQAAIFIALSANGGPLTEVANDGGTGLAAYNAAFGGFVNSISAQGFPLIGQPDFQTSAINSTSVGAGTLTIFVTQTDLNSYVGGLRSSFTSNSFLGGASSVDMSTYIDTLNGKYTGTLLASSTFGGIGTQVFDSGVLNLTGPFSETTKYVITFTGAGSVNDTINLTAVPEPATWAMMLAGFGAVGYSLRRKKSYRLQQAV